MVKHKIGLGLNVLSMEHPMHFPRTAIADHLFADEATLVASLAAQVDFSILDQNKITNQATALVQAVRDNRTSQGSIDAFMQQFSLSSDEGVVLMCLAEALLRIPDAATADQLIADKLGDRDWSDHIGKSDSLFVNASAWGLMLTGRIVELGRGTKSDAMSTVKRLITRSGEPIIRTAMKQAMRIMGKQFVLGRTIAEALDLSEAQKAKGYCFSYDMLGESAMTRNDAARYFTSYSNAIAAIGATANNGNIFDQPSISVKLSALHPRYDEKNKAECIPELFASVLVLATKAKSLNIGLTIDAEEVARLDLSLELFERLLEAPELKNWNGLGLAVQAYGRRALPTLEWLAQVATLSSRILPVRLVKGAYWDTEIKRAQEGGFETYPVFTRKASTDVSYLACAKFMLSRSDVFFPQFATHNAHSVAAISVMAGPDKRYEFQRLHGMGEALYQRVIGEGEINQTCRIYAPVGSHEDLLAYLVRRLLENGANTSFVNRLADDTAPVADIIADPVQHVRAYQQIANPRIKPPRSLFAERQNSKGLPVWHEPIRQRLEFNIGKESEKFYTASAIVNGQATEGGPVRSIKSPQNSSVNVGLVHEISDADVMRTLTSAGKHQRDWCQLRGKNRAAILNKAADFYEAHQYQLLSLLVREAGKTLDNALADLREAVDFLRYYAVLAAQDFETAQIMSGPTGERNELSLHGRGVFAAIAPWNFPLAIFTGQVAAALAAGNAVLAKSAEQTPLVAHAAIRLLLEAGVPAGVLHFLPGDGARIGARLLTDARLAGVAFTGSNATATTISRALAQKPGPMAALIAETGGMNAMIMDSSALAEQAVRDVVASAFDSAGQRCSAARILFVQDDVAPHVIEMLKGAMAELRIGDPMNYATDVGPVIDREAQQKLDQHKARMGAMSKTILDLPLPAHCTDGTFVSPAAYELSSLEPLTEEVFGPVLHVLRYQSQHLPAVVEAINNTGFGLTLGLHTRIERTVELVRQTARVGNLYVNRNQIGAVVGVQPFGGEGLSGTGPKAGGPHYLHRFAVERVMSQDTTASGGNAALMSMEDD
jgi:RHH-type transcriptional regulator, proline utilization regulon repressor / proline dehydrogenase / delta 1-pyrroline-5-carboxylate dehydrogenase